MRIIIVCLVILGLDIYVYKGISLLLQSVGNPWNTIIKIAFWLISLLLVYKLYSIFSNWQFNQINRPEFVRFWSAIFFSLTATKMVFIAFHFMGDITWGVQNLIGLFKTKPSNPAISTITRGTFITQLGLLSSGLVLGAFTYGVLKGRYSFRVLKEKLTFSNLPKSFNGLKIVQISDLHLGSFINDFEDVKKGIDMINELNPDLILFTGDMVNVHSDEAEPWIELFATLKSKYGNYSIFGNHDYCDYGSYSTSEKNESINRLKEIHREMGFVLLEDEHKFIQIGDEKIALLGMHNWGKGFHQVGSIKKTIAGWDKTLFSILLSHDPTLWEEKVKDKLDIDLTLSGHTHGMQLGVEIPKWGIKWSPVKLRYKRWAGLYSSGKNHLYINRGFGFLGFPGRVGIHPEITLIELEC